MTAEGFEMTSDVQKKFVWGVVWLSFRARSLSDEDVIDE